MPLYTYECASCGRRQDEYRPVADRERPARCECGNPARKIITVAGPVVVDMAIEKTHFNECLGEWITGGRRQLRELCRRHGFRPRDDFRSA